MKYNFISFHMDKKLSLLHQETESYWECGCFAEYLYLSGRSDGMNEFHTIHLSLHAVSVLIQMGRW
jgi:hypothetical protein